MTASLKFCGAAGTVTGSCQFVRLKGQKFLVDCGLFQGSKTLKQLNYEPFPFDPKEIDFVLLTHAHADHAALLPKLVKHGFRGPIYATEGTRDLLTFMLPDSAHIQETEVAYLNRRNSRRGISAVEPIYRASDAERCLNQIRTVDYESWVDVHTTIRARFWNAGHILGAASIEVELTTGEDDPRVLRLLFSGDIGPDFKIFHPDPDAPENFDYVICESTYGGRKRMDASPQQRRDILAREVNDALSAGGGLIIPAFAVERSQELLLDLAYLINTAAIPRVPIFLDSPLAIRVTSVFARHAEALEDVEGVLGDAFQHPSFHFTQSVDQSKSIARYKGGMIVLAASGMCEAGRIRHHLKDHLWRKESTILVTGFQAPGTLGQLLLDGKKRVKIQGEEIDVRARIRQIDVYSGHADGDDLVAWVKARLPVNRAVFINHGEGQSLAALRKDLIAEGLADDRVIVPRLDDEYDLLNLEGGPKKAEGPRRLDPDVVGKPDWHNDMAQLMIDIRQKVEKSADEKRRRAVLRQLRKALDT